jgi:hypothetical protein
MAELEEILRWDLYYWRTAVLGVGVAAVLFPVAGVEGSFQQARTQIPANRF